MKCQVCTQGIPRYAPELRSSGWGKPKDLICPICNSFHDSSCGLPTEEISKKENKLIGIDNPKLAYPTYWTPKEKK